MTASIPVRVLAIVCLALAGAVTASRVWAQDDIVAFGDSITQAPFPFDEEKRGGYPARLQDLLEDAGRTGKVINAGLSSEDTAEGLSRIDSVLAQYGNKTETMIIMEGTNDVTFIARGERSLESTVQNLEQMASKVRAKAIKVLYSTIIPRPNWVRWDASNAVTHTLVVRLRDLTSSGDRELAEPYEILENEGLPGFKKYYFCCDPVGHPKGAGFDLLAAHFAEKILGEDTLPPTISVFTKTGAFDRLAAGDEIRAVVHESGTGIRENASFFTINGRPVATTTSGTKRRLELAYRATNRDIECAGRISVRTEDQANPPNERNRIVAELAVADANVLKGDANGDCRVDGLDLSLLGIAFGSKFGEINYSFLADTDNDKKIDGDDLARMARNFGKGS